MANDKPRPSHAPEPAALKDVLENVAERISRHRNANIGEQNTKQTLVNPVLRTLGWDVDDLEDVRHEFRHTPADRPVDYALMLARTPRLFVEAKALDENLQDRRWANQIIGYATVAGVEWVVLTNGDEYRLYNSHAPVPVEEKLFRAVQVSEDVDAAVEALLLVSKQQTQENSLTALWRAYAVDRRVKDVVEAMFSPEPARWLTRRVANELEGLTQGDVTAALRRAHLTLDFPPRELPRASRHRVVAGDSTEDPALGMADNIAARGAARPHGRRAQISESVRGVTVRQLIDSRLIVPPLDVERTYTGRRLVGRIEPDGRVSFGGETYNSPSVAAAMARLSVLGPTPGRKYPQTNGWAFWQFRDQDGRLRELHVLRERLVARDGLAAGANSEAVESQSP